MPTSLAMPRIAIETVPELPTRIGMAGAMRHAEVGGAACSEGGVLVALIAYAAVER